MSDESIGFVFGFAAGLLAWSLFAHTILPAIFGAIVIAIAGRYDAYLSKKTNVDIDEFLG